MLTLTFYPSSIFQDLQYHVKITKVNLTQDNYCLFELILIYYKGDQREMTHLVKSNYDEKIVMDITPESANWDHLGFQIVRLNAGDSYTFDTTGNEAGIVPIEGAGQVKLSNDDSFEMARKDVFSELPHVLYVPPKHEMTFTAETDFEFAIGTATAEGRYPVRLFAPNEIKAEVRGGGAATRQVNHILAHPLPAERLILFEVYVPGGAWSGYPPHCHDGYGDSAYLEETYYFRFQPENGWGFHRNYRVDMDFDEAFAVQSGDCVLVTQGFHSTAAAPGSNMYFLNYLAGDLLDDDRGRPPFDDERYAWLKQDWTGNKWDLPLIE